MQYETIAVITTVQLSLMLVYGWKVQKVQLKLLVAWDSKLRE
jgi:hypothetical protein